MKPEKGKNRSSRKIKTFLLFFGFVEKSEVNTFYIKDIIGDD